jgi:hypothetical protein
MEEHIIPHVFEWEEKKQQPKELFKQVAEQGFIAASQFPLPPKEYMNGVQLPAGIAVCLKQNMTYCSMKTGMDFMISSLMMNLVAWGLLVWEWY